MNSDYKLKTNEKFKYVFIPKFENEKYYIYGVTTDIMPCETTNAIIEIVCEYNIDMANEISEYVFESEKLINVENELFDCTMMFVCSLGLDGKQKPTDKYYCYEWYDVNTDYTFYVGKGTKDRWKTLSLDARNDDFMEYYNSHNCACRFVKENITEQEAFDEERKRLIYLHNIGQAHCNHDNGGRIGATNYGAYNGMYHRTHTDEVKKKLSDLNKITQSRGKNKRARPVYVYTNELVFLKKYDCVPDATDEIFPHINDKNKIERLRSRIYYSMSHTHDKVDGYYFSREQFC